MPYNGYNEMAVKEFGGLNTLDNPTDLPIFMSPDCLDIEFVPGRVQQRPGLTSLLTANGNVNYIKTYIMPNGDVRTLFSDSTGNFWYEDVSNSPGVSNLILSGMLLNSFPNSVSQFSKEYIAFSDGIGGYDIPRQYDGTNFDRLSQGGPGAPPFAQNDATTNTPFGSPTGLTQPESAISIANIKAAVSGVATVTLSGGSGLQNYVLPGDVVKIAGNSVSGFNGTHTIDTIPAYSGPFFTVFTFICDPTLGIGTGGTVSTPHIQLISSPGPGPGYFDVGEKFQITGATNASYDGFYVSRHFVGLFPPDWATFAYPLSQTTPQFNLANSGGGSSTGWGSIQAGLHQVAVSFVTRQGYITEPSPIGSWIADGSHSVLLTQIPIGPSNVIARIIMLTPFLEPGTTFGTFYYTPATTINDNTTTSLVLDFVDTDLLDGTNADSLFDLIELGPISGITEYDSRLVAWGQVNKINNFVNLGFDGGFALTNQCPLGWTPDPANYAGGGSASLVAWGGAYQITGTGASVCGNISQGAYQDDIGDPILFPNTAYSFSLEATKSTVGIGDTLVLTLVGTGWNSQVIFNLGTAVGINKYQKLTGSFTALPATVPPDLRLYISGNGLTAGDIIYVDSISVYPTAQPVETGVWRISNVEDPESYQGITGLLQPALNNGQAATNAFHIRDFLYLVKQKSLYVTRDDGVNEPNAWEIDEVSSEVGTLSARGVGMGDEWAVLASQNGAWLFTGGTLGDDNNLSKEIQPTWDAINWDLGYLVDVKVDTKRKRIYFNVPMGATATQNNTVLTLDYTQGFGNPMLSGGVGRKWCPWGVQAASQNLSLRPNNSWQMLFGNNANNANIYILDSASTQDLTVNDPLNAYWQSGYAQNGLRLNFGYLISNAVGSGLLNLTLFKGEQTWKFPIRGWNLSPLGVQNMERNIQKQSYRVAIKFGMNQVGSYFSVQGFSLFVQPSIWSAVRGINT